MTRTPGDSGKLDSVTETRASASPNFKPSSLRFCRFAVPFVDMFQMFVWSAIPGGVLLALGIFLIRLDSLLAVIPGWLFVVLGALVLCFALLILGLVFWGLPRCRLNFENGLLTSGMVTSVDPVTVLFLGHLSTSSEYPACLGLRQITYKRFPKAKLDVGQRIPAVSVFQGGEQLLAKTWHSFDPTPILFGTGSRKRVNECLEALDDDDFKILKQCIDQSILPPSENELLVIDETASVLETRTIKEPESQEDSQS